MATKVLPSQRLFKRFEERVILGEMTSRGFTTPLRVATDGNPGVMRAVEDVFPQALRQRCQKHKMSNILGKAPKEAAELLKNEIHKAFHADTYEAGLRTAREGIERAHLLAPDDPRVIDTYGLVQLRSGHADTAARALRRAASAMPDSPQVQAHLAQALVRQGETAEAREILQRILTEHEGFPGQAEARSLLRELGG